MGFDRHGFCLESFGVYRSGDDGCGQMMIGVGRRLPYDSASLPPHTHPRAEQPLRRPTLELPGDTASLSSDFVALARALRRFDPRGPRRLGAIGVLSFLSGATEAAVLALVTTVAVAVANAGGVQSLGPFSVSQGTALVLAIVLLAANLLIGVPLARISSGVAAESGLAARTELVGAFSRASYQSKSHRRVAALQERLTTHVDRFMTGFLHMTMLIGAALSLCSFAVTALLINPLATTQNFPL